MMPSAKPKLVILISGSGSNLQSFIDQSQSGELPADIAAVVCNRPGAFGLERAEKAGIATELVDHKGFPSREDFDAELISRIDAYQPDLIILAGFMRILTSGFVSHYHGRLLNIHPSLLPKYPGLNTHQRAIDNGDSQAGATVHLVTEVLDDGASIIQAMVPVNSDDTADALAKRVLLQEHKIYPLAAKWFVEGRLTFDNNKALLDGQQLPETGFSFSD
jgi:phosphoribosylglycinamide formyltransferase-1